MTPAAKALLQRLRDLAWAGPIPATHSGPRSVGMSLLGALGITHSTARKAKYEGVVVNAYRERPGAKGGRVNLFACVPDWDLSECRSSWELARRHGYSTDGTTYRLNCTITAKEPNRQGLLLSIQLSEGLLRENFKRDGAAQAVVAWRLERLKERLRLAHTESVWVSARPVKTPGGDAFQLRFATYCPPPDGSLFVSAIENGAITLDHLITAGPTGAREKGPLFKIHPSNLPLIARDVRTFELLS